jgi:hypothetical protein
MASLSGNGIPVVSKVQTTITHQGRNIVKSQTVGDTETTIVDAPPDRTISSGSVVTQAGAVSYTEDKVWGVYMMGRSTLDRVASKQGNTRTLDVELGDNITDAVIPETLVPHVPQIDVRHTGARVTVHNSQNDSLIERASDSGAYGLS